MDPLTYAILAFIVWGIWSVYFFFDEGPSVEAAFTAFVLGAFWPATALCIAVYTIHKLLNSAWWNR